MIVGVADGEGLAEEGAFTLLARDELELGAELLVEAFGVGDAFGLVDAFGVELADGVGDGLDVTLNALAVEGPSR